ncbi:trans-sialidase, putative [Trypanosoma cruzi marinkellei]|uniref:Trans-sialidase, putative n=1 Tax=Trypanosoma cruzi marinkellei TaxID=85056 RepID=K2N2N2_TRYCR|nr:trans-sialidase, putative [Trypanosoma cruzi marinkellei]
MHSRVAAVKAPRTHNRRRVTGSSGRRREGGESERQRPNMSRHHFYSAVLLLLVVTMCCSTGGAEELNSRQVSPPEKSFVWRDMKSEETVSSLRVPSLVEMNGKVFAVAEAQCKNSSDKLFTGIVSKLLALADRASEEELTATQVKTQILVECPSDSDECASKDDHGKGSQSEKKVDVSRPTAVVEGGKIYMLVGNYSQTAVAQESGADDSGILLVKGDVSQESGTENKIKWENTNDVSRASLGEQLQSWAWLTGGGGLGVHMGNERLLFPVEGTIKKKDGEQEKNEKAVSLIMYTLSGTESWKLSKGMSDGGCSDPSVVEWKDKLMMMTACDDGRRRVYEFNVNEESWTEALGTLSRVWVNKKGVSGVGSGFITATIDGIEGDKNRDVMLVTLPVYPEEDKENGKGKLHLWLTDNTHIADIGPVSGNDDAAASSLLYKSGDGNDEELIALYEKKKADEETPSPGMVSVLLTTQLQRVKEVLKTWKEVDVRVSQLCPSESHTGERSTNTPCSSTFNITDGLVGFLSDNFSGKTWKEEYLGVNATVTDGTAAATVAAEASDKGVTFRGAWAEWPVGKQEENQLYHFANYNFTLVATVSIDGEPGGPIPLMGVKINEEKGQKRKLMELSYDKEKKWELQCDKKSVKENSRNWKAEKSQHVVILLRNDTQGSAYVDGKSMGEATCQLENTGTKGISHFYIGGGEGSAGSQEGVSVTVRNVLLYNRPLTSEEITALNTKLSIQKQKDVETEMAGIHAKEVSQPTALAAVPQITVGGQEQTGEESLKASKDTSNAGASTSTLSTVTTSSGGEEPVNPSASGTSSQGTQTMDGASSSDVNPTVGGGRGAGGTVQDGTAVGLEVGVSSGENGEMAGGTGGREEKQIREVNATALSSNLGNLSQANNTDAGTVRESGMVLPSLLLLLGLWGFAAL